MDGFLERYRWAFALALLALVALAAAAQARLKPFWWDELASYDIAQLPRPGDVWNFFRAGLDTPSPVPTLIVQQTLRHIGASEVLARTPFTAGFLCMCLCLFWMVASRYGAGNGLAALLLPAISGTFYYATELRTYGIVLGAIAFSMVCWQRLGSGSGWRRFARILGVFAGLAVAMLCHLFSIFVLIPFALGQLVRDRGARRVDFPAWIALLLAPLGLLVEIPGMQAAHRNYAGAFWSKPHSGQILFSYSYALGMGWMIATLVVLLAWPALVRRFPALADMGVSGEDSRGLERGFGPAEWTLIGSLALLPWFVWPLSHLLGVYVPRYVLALTVGVTLVVVAGTAEAMRRNRIAGIALALAFFFAFVHDKQPEASAALHLKSSLASALARQPVVALLEASTLPIVAPNTPLYSQLQHYLPPDLEKRTYYTWNTPDALRNEEDRDAEISMRLFATRLPLRVEEFTAFVAAHKSFLLILKEPLASSGVVGNVSVSWLGTYAEGMQFGLGSYTVYEVSSASDH